MQGVSFKDEAGTTGDKMRRNCDSGAIIWPLNLTLWLVFNHWANTMFLLLMSTMVSVTSNQKHFIKATSVGPGTREYSSIQCIAEGEALQGQANYSLIGKTVAWMIVRLRTGTSPEHLGQAGVMESRVHVWYRQDWVKYRSGVMGNAQSRWWVCLSDWLKRPVAGWTDSFEWGHYL